MNKFKSIIMSCQGKSKTFLHWLYNTHSEYEEEEKIFEYKDFTFWFSGTGFRNTEKMILYIGIPEEYLGVEGRNSTKIGNGEIPDMMTAEENYILHLVFPVIEELRGEYRNNNKDVREKAHFCTQTPDGCMDRKSGCIYDSNIRRYVLRMHFSVPLVNATSVNAKATYRAVKDIMEHIEGIFSKVNKDEVSLWQRTYRNQQCIRKFMKENKLCAFVADGSILPRRNGTENPMTEALPLRSPDSLRVSIQTDDNNVITGMGIKEGITVITGGGYSGKTTLLNAIEYGIYNHVPGDGREYVLTEPSALKTNAEDGRPVENINLAPFFHWLNGETELEHFCTRHASGSVSQAANIVEAVCCNVKLLLIDEDRSATNFMIRDKMMRSIVPDEPIIPFTDRIEELYQECGVSVILVIGGSSEYLAYADTVIMMREFHPENITNVISNFQMIKNSEPAKAMWMNTRRLQPRSTSQPFLYFHSVLTENEKKLILDEYSADITNLTALSTPERLNTVMSVMEKILTDKEADSEELFQKLTAYTNSVLGFSDEKKEFHVNVSEQRFYSQIRPIDAWCCINRMRGVKFIDNTKKL
ncbi:MAG: hypothetical protein J6K15_08195 [Lachnospiraceae bacterium]|nr:hypothetical protein [Lachnospiraceae bacterium]